MAITVTSDVDIASAALRLIGDQSITDFTDNSDRGRLLNATYNLVRDSVLRAHPWSFAIQRAALADATQSTVNASGQTITTFPAFEFTKAYALPNDPYCLRVLYTDFDPLGIPWRVEGRFLVTTFARATLPAVFATYIARTTDVVHYDPLFVSALELRLAATMAIPLRGDRQLSQQLWSLYQSALSEARSINGQEGTQATLQVTTLLDVR